jgi:hypothetical protein
MKTGTRKMVSRQKLRSKSALSSTTSLEVSDGMEETSKSSLFGSHESNSKLMQYTQSEAVLLQPADHGQVGIVTKKQPVQAEISLQKRKILETICKTLKEQGMEVLKLSRGDSKWQMRFLTFSKEGIDLDSTIDGEHLSCPLGLLWKKKFNPRGKEPSIANIDEQGHGGLLFSDLLKVSASARNEVERPVPKKYQQKYRDCVDVTLVYTFNGRPRSLVLRCRTTDEAHLLCAGLRVIIVVCKGGESQTHEGKTQPHLYEA